MLDHDTWANSGLQRIVQWLVFLAQQNSTVLDFIIQGRPLGLVCVYVISHFLVLRFKDSASCYGLRSILWICLRKALGAYDSECIFETYLPRSVAHCLHLPLQATPFGIASVSLSCRSGFYLCASHHSLNSPASETILAYPCSIKPPLQP